MNSATVSGMPQSRQHRPLPSSSRGRLAGRERGGVGDLQTDDGSRFAPCSGSTIDVRASASAGGRIDDVQRAVKRSGELVQRPDRQHAALAVADQHRLHAALLVVERELAGERALSVKLLVENVPSRGLRRRFAG